MRHLDLTIFNGYHTEEPGFPGVQCHGDDWTTSVSCTESLQLNIFVFKEIVLIFLFLTLGLIWPNTWFVLADPFAWMTFLANLLLN